MMSYMQNDLGQSESEFLVILFVIDGNGTIRDDFEATESAGVCCSANRQSNEVEAQAKGLLHMSDLFLEVRQHRLARFYGHSCRQLPQHVGQNPAIAEILRFLRRIHARHGFEMLRRSVRRNRSTF